MQLLPRAVSMVQRNRIFKRMYKMDGNFYALHDGQCASLTDYTIIDVFALCPLRLSV